MMALPVSTAQAENYTVRGGDTLSRIARNHQVSVAELQKANPRIRSGVIVKGQTLNLPQAPKTAEKGSKGKKQAATAQQPKARAKSENLAKTSVAAPEPKERKRAAADNTPATPAKKAELRTSANESKADKPVKSATRQPITTYRVKSGDTLAGLARRHGISAADLVELNGLDSADLQEGQKLLLPNGISRASVAAPPTPPVDPELTPSRSVSPSRRSSLDAENTIDLTPPGERTQPQAPGRPSAPAVQPPATQGTYYHVVKQGDTLSSIARKAGVSVAALRKANRNVNPNRLALNQKIHIPGVQLAARASGDLVLDRPDRGQSVETSYGSEGGAEPVSGTGEEDPAPGPPARVAYRVTEKDSMDSIAKTFGTTATELRALNQLGTFDRLTAGNFLIVPNPAGPTRG